MKKKNFLKKVTALGLCSAILASQPVFAREGIIAGPSNTTLGKTYGIIGEHTVDAYTCSVKNANGKYAYKSQVKVHVYLLSTDGQYLTKDVSNTTAAKSTTYARVLKAYNPDYRVRSATFTHIIWKSGKQYSQVYNL